MRIVSLIRMARVKLAAFPPQSLELRVDDCFRLVFAVAGMIHLLRVDCHYRPCEIADSNLRFGHTSLSAGWRETLGGYRRSWYSAVMRHPAEYVRDRKGDYPSFPPQDWRILQEWGDGYALAHKAGIRVLVDVRWVSETEAWLHVSFSRASRLPSWEDTKIVKDAFVGDNVAIICLPKVEDYINIHQFCLHLWHRVNGESCPNFTADIEGVKSI